MTTPQFVELQAVVYDILPAATDYVIGLEIWRKVRKAVLGMCYLVSHVVSPFDASDGEQTALVKTLK